MTLAPSLTRVKPITNEIKTTAASAPVMIKGSTGITKSQPMIFLKVMPVFESWTLELP